MDYGNAEWVDVVYEWHSVCNNVPIQSFVLKISGINDLIRFARLNGHKHAAETIKLVEQFLWEHLDSKFTAIVK